LTAVHITVVFNAGLFKISCVCVSK